MDMRGDVALGGIVSSGPGPEDEFERRRRTRSLIMGDSDKAGNEENHDGEHHSAE